MRLVDLAIRAADGLKPVARRLEPVLPVDGLRDLYWRLQARRIRTLPDRVFLEARVVEHFQGCGATNVLFVGTRPYTSHYPGLFADKGIALWTSDIDPDCARFGSPARHRTADLLALEPTTFPIEPDGVLLNGVIGYGVNEPEQIARALAALASVCAPGAALVLGWNTDRSVDPLSLPQTAALVSPVPGPDGKTRKTFDTSTHVYDFLVLRRPPAQSGPIPRGRTAS